MSKNKMTRDVVPQGFSMGLALVDAVPVIFFGLTFGVLGVMLGSWLFVAGAVLCFAAGLAKVIWKIIVVLRGRNVWWLFIQMRILMPVGFVMMLVGFLLRLSFVDGGAVWAGIVALPQLIFFVVGVLGMVLMMVFGFVLDSGDVRSNWIEQATNGVAQICFFVGVMINLVG